MTITREIVNHLTANPDKIVCHLVGSTGESTQISAADLLNRAGQYAALLAKRDIVRSIVGIAFYHGIDLYAAFVGTLLSNNIPTMIAPPSPRMETAKYNRNLIGLLSHIRPRVFLADEATVDSMKVSVERLPDVELLSPTVLPTESIHEVPNALLSDVAVVQHSSGTTGQQKGISLTHKAILQHNSAYAQSIQLNAKDVIVSWLPLYHDMGFIAAFLLPLTTGTPFVQMSQFDWVARPHMLLHAISHHQATLCWMPNFAFSFMADRVRDSQLDGCKLDTLRGLINCSEPVTADAIHRFVQRFSSIGMSTEKIGASYAMAENVFAVTQTSLGAAVQTITADLESMQKDQVIRDCSNGKTFVSNGPAVAGTEVSIFSTTGQPLPDRFIGEIAIRGQTLFSGYFERSDLTAMCMTKDGWFLTGDLGFTVDGQVFVSGRKKDIIIIQGRNFALSDIESLVNEVNGLIPGRVVAFGIEDERSGTEKLIVIAETKLDDESEIGKVKLEIRTRIAQTLDCTAGDVQLFNDRWLIKSTAGKLSRSENRQKYMEFLKHKPK